MEERKTIYLCLAHMSEEGIEQKYVKEAFDTNWVVPMGPNVNAFEKDLEAFVNRLDNANALSKESVPEGRANANDNCGCTEEGSTSTSSSSLDRRVVCLSAGTAAVHLALIGCGVQAGDEVLVQSFTFCASSHPITYLGAKPVFVGSEPETWNMDPVLLEKAIIDRKEKTGRYPKAIVPVALYGMPYDCEKIMAIADKYGIPVVEDAAEGMGSRFNGQVLGTFGKYGVLSFNGNKMITTSGGGALICNDWRCKSDANVNANANCRPDGVNVNVNVEVSAEESARDIMWYATQARDAYPYYQHTAIGYNYRMSNVCAGIGRGQMTVLDAHIAHHKHVQRLYKELLKDVPGVHLHEAPVMPYENENDDENRKFDANFWLCAATIDADVHVKGQEDAYKEVIKTAVGGAAGVIHAVDCATTDCQPNENVEALRVFMLGKKVECRPVWKPMHKQPVYANGSYDNDNANDNLGCRVIEGPNMACYTNGIEEELFKVGFCLPAGPYVTDEDVHYIVDCIREAVEV